MNDNDLHNEITDYCKRQDNSIVDDVRLSELDNRRDGSFTRSAGGYGANSSNNDGYGAYGYNSGRNDDYVIRDNSISNDPYRPRIGSELGALSDNGRGTYHIGTQVQPRRLSDISDT